MQTAQKERTLNKSQHLSGYDLTTLLIRGGIGKLGLNGNAKEVLLYLATCYNEKNGVVYPRVKTIASAMDISERGVIRALAELTEKGCIIRSKRKKNSNEYVITKKVLQLSQANNVITHEHNDTSSNDTASLLMNEVKQHEVKQQQPITCELESAEPQQKKNVVSFPDFSLKSIPASILAKKTDKNGKPIRSHAAYWNSFTDDQKREYLRNEALEAEKVRKKQEREKQAELEKQKKAEEEKKLQAQLNKPLNEQWSRSQAIKHIWYLRNMPPILNKKNGLPAQLASIYSLDIQAICKMSEEEIEKIS